MKFRNRCFLSLFAAIVMAARPASGADPHASNVVLPQYSRDRTLGVASCANSLCHGSIGKWQGSDVQRNEYTIWSRADKHARAYSVLLSKTAQDIAEKYFSPPRPAHEAKECLDCHAHNVAAAERTASKYAATERGFVLADGIICESFHGPAERWKERHVERGATHASNIANGMYPTSDDVARARLCLSCHFGTADKFVNHRMMAAGHPRMSFELDTFTQISPAHFQPDSDWQRRKGRWDAVRAWAVGQAVAAQELLTILDHPIRGRAGLFPEPVLFDCHACHSPMRQREESTREARRNAKLGLVRLNDSNFLMLRQIVRRVDPPAAADFTEHVDRMHRAVTMANDGLAEARAMAAVIERLLPKISKHHFSIADMKAIVTGLITDGEAGQYRDYSGAEQAVMALQSIADFMIRRGELDPAPLRLHFKRMLALVRDDERFPVQHERFVAELRELRKAFEHGYRVQRGSER